MSRGTGGLRVVLLPATPGAGEAAWEWMLPVAAVAEIVRSEGLAPPGPGAPDWLIGTCEWRGLVLPAVRLGAPPPSPELVADRRRLRPYLAICLGARRDPLLPFFAVECLGLPRLEGVAAEMLVPVQGERPFALAALQINGRPASVLDLDSVEGRLLAERSWV
jgi:chemotaxis signal transduction protein